MHNIEALIREAYEILKLQVDTEGEPTTKPKSRQMKGEEEVACQQLRKNDVANMKTEVRYDGIAGAGEGVEEANLSSCRETTDKDKTMT